MTESEYTNRLCAALRKVNAEIFVATTPRGKGQQQSWSTGTPGWPDRYIAHTLWQGWLEFKAGDARLQALQAAIIRSLNAKTRGLAYVVRHGVDAIENADGDRLALYDGTALGLLMTLRRLTNE